LKICLINSPTGAEFLDRVEFVDAELRKTSCSPQLGVLNLAAVTEKLGIATGIYDCNRAFFRLADAAGECGVAEFATEAAHQIAASHADVYGFSSICSAYPLTLRMARIVKKLQPDATILLGGPQASVVAEDTLKAFPSVDFILRGEAEQSLPLFLEELSGSRNFEKVPGLVHRTVWGVQRNPDPPPISDLDALPAPAYHLTGELIGAPSASLELGRGCPFSCTFCSTNDFFRRKFRLRSPERVRDDMRLIHSLYGISDFDLIHDMFTVDAKRVRAFCKSMIEAGTGFTWECSARTDCVDEEMLGLMAAAGCTAIFFGVETGSERMQKLIDKHLDIERAHQVIDLAERAGISSTVSLITGFPEERWDDLRETVRVFMHSARTPRSKPQLNLLSPLANTPLHTQHKHELVLDQLCSDVSHQGRWQNPEDLELIRKFPHIFPNFYFIPTPHLDRAILLELREFTLMANHGLRWLLGAADQACSGILELFVEWVDYRKAVFPAQIGPDLRHYYRTPDFQKDFIAFLRQHPAGLDTKVELLNRFYRDLLHAPSPDASRLTNAVELPDNIQLHPDDVPVRSYESRIVELASDLDAVIEAVQACRPHRRRGRKRFYVVSQTQADQHPGFEISDSLARVLQLCDGRNTIAAIMDILPAQIAVTPAQASRHVYDVLLDIARSKGLIAIYRTACAAESSHAGGFSMPAYSEINAAASRQNHSPTQAE